MTTLRLAERGAGPSQCVLEVHGELGLPDIDRLQEALATAAAEARYVVVAMEDCEFIDSVALAALIRARDRLANDGRRLVTVAPSAQMRRVLEITGLDQDGFIFDSVEQALSKPHV